MLKKLFKRRRVDVRFMDAEIHKYRGRPRQNYALDDEPITVFNKSRYSVFEDENSEVFLELLKKAAIPQVEQLNDAEQELSQVDDSSSSSIKSLGVFSDSKIYSALIHNILNQNDVHLMHFNHPCTFLESGYSFFDEIDAWIIFLSEESEQDFLDAFLDRYVEKPSLFLVPKMSKQACVKRINSFLQEHHLSRPIIKETSCI